MEIRLENGVVHSSLYELRKNEEETGLTEAFTYTEDLPPPVWVGDTFNGYKKTAISLPLRESILSLWEFSSDRVATTVPTRRGQFAYIFPSLYMKSLEFLNRGGILTGILTGILGISTMMGYISSAVGISATAALGSIFSAFIIERVRLSRK